MLCIVTKIRGFCKLFFAYDDLHLCIKLKARMFDINCTVKEKEKTSETSRNVLGKRKKFNCFQGRPTRHNLKDISKMLIQWFQFQHMI